MRVPIQPIRMAGSIYWNICDSHNCHYPKYISELIYREKTDSKTRKNMKVVDRVKGIDVPIVMGSAYLILSNPEP